MTEKISIEKIFEELHYKVDGKCYCPNSANNGFGKCKYCGGTDPKEKKEKKK